MLVSRFTCCALIPLLLPAGALRADPPSASYIFPAGGQRGTTVKFKVGAHNLHDSASFEMRGPGVEAAARVTRTETLFFEGPLIPLPDSQAKETYPKDYAGEVSIAADAAPGNRYWHVATSQGITPGKKFVVGDLPEIVEQEIDGRPIPTPVTLPVTINGRIFPREDVDVWTFEAKAGQAVTCEVNAARLGSPLDSRLEVRDPAGRRIAENVDALGTDSRLRFTPEVDGTYEVRIHDVQFRGLQDYVYRLTITAGPVVDAVFPLGGRRGTSVELELSGANLPESTATVVLPADGTPTFTYRPQFCGAGVPPASTSPEGVGSRDGCTTSAGSVQLELDDLPEFLDQPTAGQQPQAVAVPAVCNGRIAQPGEADLWAFEAKKGEQYVVEVAASRLGSPLDSLVTLLDADGKQIAQNDDAAGGQTDSRLTFDVPADGTFTVRVEDRLPSRGGPTFAYRLKIARPDAAAPGFRLTLPADAVTLERGKEVQLKIDAQRLGGFGEEIALAVDNLPAGVSLAGPAKIDKGKNDVQLTLKAEESAAIDTARLVVRGTATIDGNAVDQRAAFSRDPHEPPADELLLRVAVPTPFKVVGEFSTQFASRGTVYNRHYMLERGGFEGPIEVRMADVQARHLQGVTGPVVAVPPGQATFDYSITLPPWMEIGRTSRTCVMAVGEVTDPDGTRHKVSYTSEAQNDQIILLVDPGRLSIRTGRPSIREAPGSEVRIPFQVERAAGLKGPVSVELVVPRHIQGVQANAVNVSADADAGELTLSFGDGGSGPFNMPLTLRAVMQDEAGRPVTAEAELTVVPQ